MIRLWLVVLAGITLSAQFSKEKEAALGAGLAADWRRRTTAIDDPAAHAYLEGIGKRFGGEWKWAVIRDERGGPTHEPIWFPGGYIFVSAPLILAAANEAELAGMLAHAMVHITERHGMRPAERGQAENVPATIPLIFAGGLANGEPGLAPLGFQKIWRVNELEADRMAPSRMAAAGYDPAALNAYLRRTQPERATAAETPFAGQPGAGFQAIQERIRQIMIASKRVIPPPTLRRKNER